MKLTDNLKMFIIGTFVLVVGIFFVILGNTISTSDSTILKDQEVDNLTFQDAKIEYENNTTTFEVEVTNNKNEEYNLKYIEIIFKSEDDKIDKMVGYIGNSIKENETKKVITRIDKDLTNSISLEYSIIK